jgi:hypothetical protein
MELLFKQHETNELAQGLRYFVRATFEPPLKLLVRRFDSP